MGYVLGFDVGVASVGAGVIDSETGEILEGISYLFPEADATKNQNRRDIRDSRRVKRRQRTRINDFKKLWNKCGFIDCKNVDYNLALDMVGLRVNALTQSVSMEQLYLILQYHLKHRGISYLEDSIDESTGNLSSYAKGIDNNRRQLQSKYPCEIQKERMDKYGKYRGETKITKILDGEKEDIILSNVFTVSSYEKEIKHTFATQQKYHSEISDEFVEKYLSIFKRKRKYYEGPGNELSRTDYGKYTTRIDEDGNYITEENIFEKLIGKCSVYEDEFRAAGASYTAQEFNVLNDLNNLVVNGEKLSEDNKRKIIDIIKQSNTVNMKNIIKKVIGESIETMTGARVDKDEKEIFHKFEIYNKMRKVLEEIDVDITTFSRELLDEIGHVLTLNTEKEGILDAIERYKNIPVIDDVTKARVELANMDSKVLEVLINLRKKNSKLFSKWQSFSLKIMKELIPEMYSTSKEQMTLLQEMGKFKSKVDIFATCDKIPVDILTNELYNPVVTKSIRVTLRVFNAMLEKYKHFEQVVIEMPRERNSDEKKKYIGKMQKLNEKESEYIEGELRKRGIEVTSADYSEDKKLALKLKLWNEQNGKCLYSGRTIDPQDIINSPEMFEIDHIIPISISFDDSRTNKVLVYRTQNQLKGNKTPYMYLTSSDCHDVWSWEQYSAYIIQLSNKKKENYPISKKKLKNLLYKEDITKQDVLKGFINRNINDTAYASRVVLNTLQDFFKAKEEVTKVKVIKGSFTNQMRKNLHLKKDRDESNAHHAIDALLIAYSVLGYNAYRKIQSEVIDFETGEILDESLWNDVMSEDKYEEVFYNEKWIKIRGKLNSYERKVKFWYMVDHKCNRQLTDQTIYGTRQIDGKTYQVGKLDIRDKKGYETFKKILKKDKNRFLIARNDPKTFENLLQIMNDYSDKDNPFVAYEEETGDYIRKYAKKHNGARLGKLRYLNGELGSCVDVSHKYGFEKGSKRVILGSLKPYRADVYFNKDTNKYRIIGIKYSDIVCKNGDYYINTDAYNRILIKDGLISEGQTYEDLKQLGFEFKLSFYKNDIIKYTLDDKTYIERFLSKNDTSKNYVETKPVDKNKFEKQHIFGLTKATKIEKLNTDIMGDYHLCTKGKFTFKCKV